MATSTGVSPSVSAGEVVTSMVVYTLLYGAPGRRRGEALPHLPARRRTALRGTRSTRRRRTTTRPSRSPTDPATRHTSLTERTDTQWSSAPSGSSSSPSCGPATSSSRASTSASACCCRSSGGAPTRPTPRSAAACMVNTIGPVWDGNEVWVLTAGGATFAAFPHWYATMFSAFYLPLLLILVALIVRNLGFDYRGKRDDDRWRAPLGHGHHRRLGRPGAAVGRRPDQRGARPADRRRQGVHGQPVHAAQPGRPCSAAW